MFYHKVYMNQIHSSSLLCQLASMWKNQVLCDAVIKTGNIVTKAHRVVLVAACPMLHSMKNASTGSNLEVRLAADITQEAITTFLQYLYEGFMMLTEANCKEVEKIARVLQVDSVLKCCADFYKCLHSGNGYEYSFHDNVEFRHVRASDMLKVHERSKRLGDSSQRPESPASKRMRSFKSGSSDQSWQTDHGSGSYSGTGDPWDRVPRDKTQSSTSSRASRPGVIDMVEDSVEIVHTEPAPDPGGRRELQRTTSLPQDRMALSVASEISPSSDVQIIDTSYSNSGPSSAQEDSISVIGSYSAPSLTSMPTSSTNQSSRSHMSPRFPAPPLSAHKHPPSQSPHLLSQSPPRPRPSLTSSSAKPFAAGSVSQTMRGTGMSPTVTASSPAATQESPVLPSPVSLWRSQSAEIVPPDKSPTLTRSEAKATSDVEVMSDISIIKIETGETVDPSHDDDPNLTSDPGDLMVAAEDASNEGSNLSGDKSLPQWLSDSMKEPQVYGRPPPPLLLPSFHTSGTNGQAQPRDTENRRGRASADQIKESTSDTLDRTELRSRPRSADPALKIPRTPTQVVPVAHGNNQSPKGSVTPTEQLKTQLPTPQGPFPLMLMSSPGRAPVQNQAQGMTIPTSGINSQTGLKQERAVMPVILGDHKKVTIGDHKQKLCAFCQFNKVRTKRGWVVLTQFKCEKCDLPLCIGERNCFVRYHTLVLSGNFPALTKSKKVPKPL